MKLSMPTEYISDKLGFDKTFEVVSDAGFDAMDFTFCAHKKFYTEDTEKKQMQTALYLIRGTLRFHRA